MTRIRLLAVAAAVSVLGVGCATTLDGTAQPAEPPGPPSAAPSAPPGPTLLPIARVADTLLKPGELQPILGDDDMKQVSTATRPDADHLAQRFDPDTCGERLGVGLSPSYGLPAAFAETVSQGARSQLADQAIAIYNDPAMAATLIKLSGIGWGECPENQLVTVKIPGVNAHWITGPIISQWGVSRIATTNRRQEQPPRTCTHVMAAKNNVAVDIAACGDGDTLAAANEIVDRILAKVPQ